MRMTTRIGDLVVRLHALTCTPATMVGARVIVWGGLAAAWGFVLWHSL